MLGLSTFFRVSSDSLQVVSEDHTGVSDPTRFANNRPNGQETVDWLGEQGLISYIMYEVTVQSFCTMV